jgi:NADH dehydrogenase
MGKQKILVVGGGFGGVKAALELVDDERFEVTLLTPELMLRYYPTLYHVATGGKRSNANIPLEVIFANKDITLIEAEAVTLDRKAKTITDREGHMHPYDILILGLGSVTNYFGIPGLAEYSFGIKSTIEVERFKQHLHKQLIEDHVPDHHYVIVGAGPTGIELAGSLPAYLHHVMKLHGITDHPVHVDLIEAAPRLLPRMPQDTSRMVKRQLKRLGVRLYLGKAVQGLESDELTVNGKPIRSHTVIWTAGVSNHPFFTENKFVIINRGKVATDFYLQAEPNIFVIGDNANTPYSGLAQTALHDAVFVARNIKRAAKGKTMSAYKPVRPATVIPAGNHWAAVNYGQIRLYGWLGWALREAADLIAFHDYESWPIATKQWETEFGHESECPICLSKEPPS